MTTPASQVDFLIVTQYFRPELGAAQVRLGALVDELRGAGHRVEVLTSLPNYPTGRIFPGWPKRAVSSGSEDGVRVTRVWSWAATGSGPGRIANYLSFGAMSVLGLRHRSRPRWVVVEYPTLFGALPAVLWARRHRIRLVVKVADLWVDVLAQSGLLPKGVAAALGTVERWMLRQADAVTVVTEGLRDAVVAKGVNPSRICWLPNGVDTDLFHPPADDVPVADGPAQVLYAGTHGHVHGLEVVLDAAEHLADRPVRFLLVGGGSEKDSLVAEATRRGLDNVEFRDPVPITEVAELLRESTVGLATVRDDPLFTSVRSAKAFPVMATGIPLIYSGDDEGAALAGSIGAATVTPPGDGRALADAVAALVDDPARAAAMGRAGREWTVGNASWTVLVDRWVDQIEGLLAKGVSTRNRSRARPVVGFVGIHAGGRPGQAVSQNETLADLFESVGQPVLRSSAVRRPALRTLHQAYSLLRWRDRVQVVVVACFSGPSFFMVELAAGLRRWTGAAVVVYLHGGRLADFGRGHRRRVRRAFDQADLIVAPSSFLADEFRTWGYDVRIIPNVVAIDRYPYSPRTTARPRLLWMRTLHDIYHPEMAIEVLAHVAQVHPDVTLTMAGADRGKLATLVELAERLGVSDRVTFPGYITMADKLTAFAEHDVFLHTNRVDNMPVSVIEASAAGLVTVATKVGGIPHLLTDGVDARLVDDGNVAAMTEAVLELLRDDDQYSALGLGARALAERSGWTSVRSQWQDELAAFVRPPAP